MKRRYLFILLFTLALSDILLLNMSLFLGYHLSNKYLVDVAYQVYSNNIWSCTIIWLVSSAISRLYTYNTIKHLQAIYRSTLLSLALFGVAFTGYVLITNPTTFPIVFLASLLPLVGMSFVFSRFTAKALNELWPSHTTSQEAKQVHVSKFESQTT